MPIVAILTLETVLSKAVIAGIAGNKTSSASMENVLVDAEMERAQRGRNGDDCEA